jgi:hypothetical protein
MNKNWNRFFPDFVAFCFILALSLIFASCKMGVKPEEREFKGYPRKADIRNTVENEFRTHNVQCTANVDYSWEDVAFRADGLDFNLQVGWVFQPEEQEYDPDNPPNLTGEERARLPQLARDRGAYFLVVDARTIDGIREQTQEFIQMLYGKRVIEKNYDASKDEQGGLKEGDNSLQFEKEKGRKVDPGKLRLSNQQENPEEVLKNIEAEQKGKASDPVLKARKEKEEREKAEKAEEAKRKADEKAKAKKKPEKKPAKKGSEADSGKKVDWKSKLEEIEGD